MKRVHPNSPNTIAGAEDSRSTSKSTASYIHGGVGSIGMIHRGSNLHPGTRQHMREHDDDNSDESRFLRILHTQICKWHISNWHLEHHMCMSPIIFITFQSFWHNCKYQIVQPIKLKKYEKGCTCKSREHDTQGSEYNFSERKFSVHLLFRWGRRNQVGAYLSSPSGIVDHICPAPCAQVYPLPCCDHVGEKVLQRGVSRDTGHNRVFCAFHHRTVKILEKDNHK